MADDEIRDDGTVICPLHGMRYDPALTEGCIRCPRSIAPGKRSAPPRSSAPKSNAPKSNAPLSRVPPPRMSAGPARISAPPPVPFDPGYLDSSSPYAPYQAGPQQSGPVITIVPGPQQFRTSRRGLIGFLGLLVAGGGGAAAWVMRPEGATDWASKLTTFRYGPSASLTGTLYVPSAAAERPCPLLVLLEHTRRPAKICTRFARHCEEHGWICASSDAFGSAVASTDDDAAALFLEAVRANANVDGGRPVLGGFDSAGEAACRLAILEPKNFAGAILECCGTGPWRDLGAMARSDLAFFLFTRDGDPAREGMVTMKDEMQRRGLRLTYDQIAGSHAAMERDELDPAFAWLATIRG
jgi:hypothetical protein